MKRYNLSTILATAILGMMLGASSLPAADKPGLQDRGKSDSCRQCAATTVRIGKPAPDFSLEAVVSRDPGKEFRQISLKDYRGKWLVMFFYPADFTFVCPTEIRGFNDAVDSMRKLNAEIIAISTDSKWSHLAWLKRGDLGELRYPLLADFNKNTAADYNVLDNQTGIAQRGLFIVDPEGIVQYQVVHNLDVGRSVDETLRVLEALQSGGLCPLGWKPGQKTLGK